MDNLGLPIQTSAGQQKAQNIIRAHVCLLTSNISKTGIVDLIDNCQNVIN